MPDDDGPSKCRSGAFVNISGDYRYLGDGYYDSVMAEVDGLRAFPTTEQALDAYIVPLCLERSRSVGIPTMPYHITNGAFEPPAIVYPLNPYMRRHSVVLRPGRVESIARSMTRNHKFAICVQPLEGDMAIREFHCILGQTARPEYAGIAERIWDEFGLPLCLVRVARNHDIRLSAIEPLPLRDLNRRELDLLKGVNAWQR